MQSFCRIAGLEVTSNISSLIRPKQGVVPIMSIKIAWLEVSTKKKCSSCCFERELRLNLRLCLRIRCIQYFFWLLERESNIFAILNANSEMPVYSFSTYFMFIPIFNLSISALAIANLWHRLNNVLLLSHVLFRISSTTDGGYFKICVFQSVTTCSVLIADRNFRMLAWSTITRR